MAGKLKELAGNTAIYSLGTLLTQFVSFLLLPLYTRILTPADYGALSLLVIVQSVMAITTELALNSGVFRFYHAQPDARSRDRLVATAVLVELTSAVLIGGALQLAAPALAPVLFDFADPVPLFRLAIWIGSIMPFAQLGLRVLQLEERPVAFVAHSFGQFLVATTVTIALVAVWRLGVAGVLIGQLCGVGTQALATAIRVGPRVRRGADRALARTLARFSIPLVPTNLAGLTMALADRFFLQKLDSLSATGIYAVADKMVAVVQILLIVPFCTAWTQYAFRHQSDEDLPATFARVFRLYAVVGTAAVLGFSFVVRELMQIATTAEFAAGYTLVPLLVVAPLMHGFTAIFAVSLHLRNRTAISPVLFGIATVLNLSLNAWWIPMWGAWGAAAATAVSLSANSLMYGFVGSRELRAPYPLARVALLLLGAAAILGVYVAFDPAGFAASVGFRLALTAGFVGWVAALGVAPRHELKRVAHLIRARLPGGKAPQ